MLFFGTKSKALSKFFQIGAAFIFALSLFFGSGQVNSVSANNCCGYNGWTCTNDDEWGAGWHACFNGGCPGHAGCYGAGAGATPMPTCSGAKNCSVTCNDGYTQTDACPAMGAYQSCSKWAEDVCKNRKSSVGQPSTGGGSNSGGQTNSPVSSGVCAAGSSTGCVGKPFMSTPDGAGLQNYACFPKQYKNDGSVTCGRDIRANIPTAVDPNTNTTVTGVVLDTNVSSGGCPLVVQCGCASGLQQACLPSNQSLAPAEAANYCVRAICSPVGSIMSNGQEKKCQPGQVTRCLNDGTSRGEVCNPSGTGTNISHAHACGATHTVAYCFKKTNQSSWDECEAGAQTFNSQSACVTACVTAANSLGAADSCAAACSNPGVAQIAQLNENQCTVTNGNVSCKDASGNTISSRSFIGCGSGDQSRWNCYRGYINGSWSDRFCVNEPGLSCGAQPTSETPTTPTTPTNPDPTPTPTPIPTAVCGQPCGPNAGGAVCTGTNLACVDGTCRSNQCSPSEQDGQCTCAPPPQNPPVCVDIYASKTNIQLNDQVSFSCAPVANTERYEFRFGFTTSREITENLTLMSLNVTEPGGRVSVPVTIDKVGRYFAQCRPCSVNNLCGEWEAAGRANAPIEVEPTGTGETTQPETSNPEEESTGEVSVSENNLQGWGTFSDAGGSISFVQESESPLGNGALRIVLEDNNDSRAAMTKDVDILLKDLNTLEYATKQISGPTETANVSFILGVDIDGDDTQDTTFIFEPYYNGTIESGWQTWNVKDGKFWANTSVGEIVSVGGGSTESNFTLSSVLEKHPDAKIRFVGISVGGSTPSWGSLIDAIKVNNTVYNFENEG